MSGFTAEDFAQANRATRGDLDVASRVDPEGEKQWRFFTRNGDAGWLSDEDMVAEGWVPVAESRVTEHTLRDSQESAARKREKLVDHIADQDRVIRRRNDEIATLRRELADAQAPLSLDVLSAAWEAAEVPTGDNPIREGDVVIYTSACGTGLTVHKAAVGQFGREASGYVRILSRAPRAPWQDLADDLNRFEWDLSPNEAARELHAAGWRKGGDEA